MKLDQAQQNGQMIGVRFGASLDALQAGGTGRVGSTLSGAVASAVAIVDSGYRDGVNARQIARLIGVDRSRLAAAFRQQTGLTLHEYIVWVRLETALTLIAAGTKIEAVALLVGYRD